MPQILPIFLFAWRRPERWVFAGAALLAGVVLASAYVIPLLAGRDAHAIEDTWQYLYRGAYWRRGPVTMSAIAAVDTAPKVGGPMPKAKASAAPRPMRVKWSIGQPRFTSTKSAPRAATSRMWW